MPKPPAKRGEFEKARDTVARYERDQKGFTDSYRGNETSSTEKVPFKGIGKTKLGYAPVGDRIVMKPDAAHAARLRAAEDRRRSLLKQNRPSR